jgi:hypothetical protein
MTWGFVGWLVRHFGTFSDDWKEEKREVYKQFGKVPNACVRCELLGICREKITKKGEVGKCRNGCLIAPPSYPPRCQKCEYLTECRRPLSEGGKCRNGCRIIKENERKSREKS